jgi:hypothetical protein
MGRVQYYCAQSLDGYIAEPDDGLDWLLSIGDGIPTLARRLPGRLRLADTRTFDSGLVQLAYEVG